MTSLHFFGQGFTTFNRGGQVWFTRRLHDGQSIAIEEHTALRPDCGWWQAVI
jgi:hypothetical protein